MNATSDSIARWIRHRIIPKNSANVHSSLSKCGLNLNRPMSILNVSKGLSLNDCYWVVEEGFEGHFSQYNLYENRFSRMLGLIAFTGYGSSVRTSLAPCPEFTTNGMLPKCWRRESGAIRLYKGETSGASNMCMMTSSALRKRCLPTGTETDFTGCSTFASSAIQGIILTASD